MHAAGCATGWPRAGERQLESDRGSGGLRADAGAHEARAGPELARGASVCGRHADGAHRRPERLHFSAFFFLARQGYTLFKDYFLEKHAVLNENPRTCTSIEIFEHFH